MGLLGFYLPNIVRVWVIKVSKHLHFVLQIEYNGGKEAKNFRVIF